MKRSWLRFAFLPLVISVLGLIWFIASDTPSPSSGALQTLSNQDTDPDRTSSLEAPPQVSGDRRESASANDRSLLRGLVRSVEGHPLPAARVRWLGLRSRDAEAMSSWTVAGLDQPDRRAVEAETDDDGVFEFDGPREHPYGSVLIAFHPGHYPGGIDLTAEPSEWPANPVIVLERGMPIRVEVVDPLGKPQSGASVHHAALPRSPDPERPSIQTHELFFAQDGVTGADGRVALTPFHGEQILWAEKGELISVPWQGEHPSSVVLTLGESFTLGGTVTISDLSAEDFERSELRILVSGLKGNLWRQVAHLRDVREGAWGPVRVPLDGVARYEVRLEGALIIPVEEPFGRPRDASQKNIDFVSSGGAELLIAVDDESKQPIPTARAEAWWEPGMLPNVRVHGVVGANGVIRLGALPPGVVRFNVSAPGYATQDSWDIEVSGTTRTDATLQKGGSIAGRCLHEGEPLTDFEVIYWRVGNVSIIRHKSFLGREDGRFEIDGLASGDWSLHAASPVYPCGRPQTVSVDANHATQVELHLPTAIRGGGRVLAGETGEPVPGARVQPYSSGGTQRSLPWGPGVLTSADGSFDIDAFAPGLNYLTIEADGFAMGEAETNATAEDFVDWGDIRLERPQVLQVSLLGLEDLHGLGPEDFRARTEEGYILPEKRFDRGGVIRFEGVPPGDMRFGVVSPDGSWARLHLKLDPGNDWAFDLQVAGERKLEVRVTDSRGQELPYSPHVMVGGQEETGMLVVRMKQAVDGQASFEGIRAAKVQVIALDPDSNFVASQDVAFGADASRTIELRVGEQPFRVHVLDADRAPVTGAHVTVRSAAGAEVHGVGQTSVDGWAEIVGLPSGTLLMDVQHGVLGRTFGIPIDAAVKELEFVLEATASLELELVDGDMPLAGVLTRIQTTAGVTLGDARQTDDQGNVRYESLGEGHYNLACHRADCWPAVVDEELVTGEQARVRVQMWRLAELEFTLLNPDGLPVSDVAVEFRSDEFDVPIDAWLAEERIRAPGGLTTDQRGSIRVEGLPRGTYSWSATVLDQALTGVFELNAGTENRVSGFLAR